MAAELGRRVAEQRGWEALRAIGWSIQRPRPRHARAASPEEQAAFDGDGWRTAPLRVPEGIRLVYLPPHTPELQPTETLWVHVDEPIVNRHFDPLADLDAVVAERCKALADSRDLIRGQAGFNWWPNRAVAS